MLLIYVSKCVCVSVCVCALPAAQLRALPRALLLGARLQKLSCFVKLLQNSSSAVAAQAEQRQCRAAEKGTGSRVGKLSLGRGREKGISI